MSSSISRTAALAAYDGIVNNAYIMLSQAIRQRPTPPSSPRRSRSCGWAGRGHVPCEDALWSAGDRTPPLLTDGVHRVRGVCQRCSADPDRPRPGLPRLLHPLHHPAGTRRPDRAREQGDRGHPPRPAAGHPAARLATGGSRGLRRADPGGHAGCQRAGPAGQQRRLVHVPGAHRDWRDRPAPGDPVHHRGDLHRPQPGPRAARTT
jgi:hypothetical protein